MQKIKLSDMNKPINFELAKLLKEKGFHEITLQCYRTIEHTDDRLKWWKVGTLNEPIYCKLADHNDGYYGICSAPTIAEVVMWLYEKYGVWVVVNPHKGKDDSGKPFMEFDPEVWSFTNECVFT